MHSFDKLHKGFIRHLPAAAILAALLVLLLSASADDGWL